ncbi:MAG: HWE histidine kinase domain-containing protein, partial [Pseudolabrys sp.]
MFQQRSNRTLVAYGKPPERGSGNWISGKRTRSRGRCVGIQRVRRRLQRRRSWFGSCVKNTLAMVQAITASTARATDNIEDFKTALFGRIQSLAKTHLLLSDEERAVKFADILR